MHDIRRELREINLIMADYPHTEKLASKRKADDTLKNENLLEHFKNELGQLKSLLEILLNP